jgi:hypothetical protein
MVLADYVRQDGGVVNIMGAGIDTISPPRVPVNQPIGIAVRISFDAADQVGQQHHVKISFVGPGHQVLTVEAHFVTPERPPGLPEHWRTSLGVASQLLVPLPSYGDYTCEFAVDDGSEILRSIDFRVVPPQG